MYVKICIMLALLVINSIPSQAAQNPENVGCGIITWSQSLGGGQYRYLEGAFQTAEAANQAHTAFLASNQDYVDGGGSGLQGAGIIFESDYWRCYFAKHATQPGVYENYFVYPVVGALCGDSMPPYRIVGDQDNDGIKDGVDPYPSSSDPFMWSIFAKVYDGSGNLVGIGIETFKDGEKQVLIVGEYDTGQGHVLTLVPSSGLKDQDDYADLWGQGSMEVETAPDDLWPEHEYKIEELPTLPENNAGVDNEGQDTEDLLRDVVSNTKNIADNQGSQTAEARRQTELLDDIRKNLVDLNKREDAVQKDDQVNVPDLSNAGRSDVQAAYDTVAGQIDGDVSQDVPEKVGLGDRLDSETAIPNDVQSAYSQSGVEASAGSCEVTVSVLGRNLTFSFCDWQAELLSLGLLFQGLAGLQALLIVAGRG